MLRDMVICAHNYCVKRSPDCLIINPPMCNRAGRYLLNPHVKYAVYSPLSTVSSKTDRQYKAHAKVINSYSG
jgi:hypothetical protein